MKELDPDPMMQKLQELVEGLVVLRDGAAALSDARNKVQAGDADSIARLRARADTALDIIASLRVAVAEGDVATVRRLAGDMSSHVANEVADAVLVEDLRATIAEANDELSTRVGRHRSDHKSFVDLGGRLIELIPDMADRAERLAREFDVWTPVSRQEETVMSKRDGLAGAFLGELRGIGRQISFLTERVAPPAMANPLIAPGRHADVSDQLIASLEARGLPHHGVQFASGMAPAEATTKLVRGLLDSFREEVRDGNTIFVPGRSEDRLPTQPPPGQIETGAPRVAARLVRGEADHILDILDRLPDMSRFGVRPDAPSAATMRKEIALRFEDLDEVMGEPIGVNPPRADFTLRRIIKSILDFFDYANLERELIDMLVERGGGLYLPHSRVPRPLKNDDEVSIRRSVVRSEELRLEIAALAESFLRLVGHVRSPLGQALGTAAARLEHSLTVAHDSAKELRGLLARSGSSIAEQDVQLFEVRIAIPDHWANNGGAAGVSQSLVQISAGQVMDWIIEVAEPYVDSQYRSALLEPEDFKILVDELDSQSVALGELLSECNRLGFAYQVPGPMRQLEELRFHITAASKLARKLTGGASDPDKPMGQGDEG